MFRPAVENFFGEVVKFASYVSTGTFRGRVKCFFFDIFRKLSEKYSAGF